MTITPRAVLAGASGAAGLVEVGELRLELRLGLVMADCWLSFASMVTQPAGCALFNYLSWPAYLPMAAK